MGQQDAGDRSQLVTHHQRRDIQGLRAVAVGLVIANHVFHHPVGGFLGVDVFFVISGYLITGLLLREQGRTHRISLLDFYARRARRILPLALLVLAVTTALARLQLNVTRAHDTGVDALWALAFGSNVHFSHIGTDYFQQDRPASPIQHFWSLAVEEQFYVVWPAVLIVSYLLLRRSRTVVLLVLTAASFLWCLHATATSPTSAYFSTPARAWELGGGALLASIPDLLTRLTPRSRELAGWCGTGLLLVCVLTIGTDGFPGNYAALPVLATALMLLSGEGRTPGWGIGRGLALAPVVYLGDLSYSLYLWHWPILVLGNAFVGDSLTDRLAILATTLAVSAASFHLLERPVLASDWLLRRRKPASSKRGLAIMVALLVAAVGTIVVATPPLPTAMKLDATDGPEAPPGGRPPGGAAQVSAARLTTALREAVQATHWPVLTPGFDAIATARAPEFGLGCFDPPTIPSRGCSFALHAPTKTALVLGDSIAVSWLPGLRAALEPRGYTVHALAFKNCPVAAVQIAVPNAEHDSTVCKGLHEDVAREVAREKPDLVIMSDQARAIKNLKDGKTGPDAEREWSWGLRKQITAMTSPRTHFVVLSPNPEGPDPAVCDTPGSRPSDCLGVPDSAWHSKSNAEKEATRLSGATYIDTSPWFCDTDLNCPIFAAGIPMRWDRIHLTAPYSRLLGPQLAVSILGALGSTSSSE